MASWYSIAAFLSRARSVLAAPPSSRRSPLTFVIGNESADIDAVEPIIPGPAHWRLASQVLANAEIPSVNHPLGLEPDRLEGPKPPDLDSLCSTLLAAYLGSTNTNIHIPIAHIHRQDLALRPELLAVLREAGLSRDDVLTLDDIPDTLASNEAVWVLVDHNAPVGILGPKSRFRSPRVVAVIDHHDEERVVKPGPDVQPHIIRTCGSCASLVTEYFKDSWDRLSSSSSSACNDDNSGGEDVGKQLAHIALGPILIDTTNLLSAPKTTKTDIWAAEFLEAKLKSVDGGHGQKGDPKSSSSMQPAAATTAHTTYSRDRFYKELSSLKKDCSQMTYRDILRKDYKSWTEGNLAIGISTAPQPFSSLLSKSKIDNEKDLASEFGSWAEEQKLDIAALMTTGKSPEGEFQRELALWARNEPGVRAMEKFVSSHAEGLQLRPYQSGEEGGRLDIEKRTDEWRRFWRQGEVKESRKQVAPKLREATRDVDSVPN